MTTIHLCRSRKCEFMGIACVLMILHLIALLQTNAPKTQTHALAHDTSTSIQQKQKYKPEAYWNSVMLFFIVLVVIWL